MLLTEAKRRGGRFERHALARNRLPSTPASRRPWPLTMFHMTEQVAHVYYTYADQAVLVVGAFAGLADDDADVRVNEAYRAELSALLRGDGPAGPFGIEHVGASGAAFVTPCGPSAVAAGEAFFDRPCGDTFARVTEEHHLLIAHMLRVAELV